ncbi:hypothetical protein [Fodinicola acaciae]|uniref:hypothetical protein n=1 Tax=Fodinicola acaciae TaxID=2681555 RepID=UPI0013D00F42|nr:hypothetical protein [Fodinicola acaciae]
MWLELLRLTLTSVHVLVEALWFGAMAYSIAVVQPRILADAGSAAAAEPLATTIAAGARWKVVGLIATLVVTGVALALLHENRTPLWWVVTGVRALILLTVGGLFWHVSWRMWPRRIFALPAEIPGHQAAFRRIGWTMLSLVGAFVALGVDL